jgi:hypothetical protein
MTTYPKQYLTFLTALKEKNVLTKTEEQILAENTGRFHDQKNQPTKAGVN